MSNSAGGLDYTPVNSSITFSALKTFEQISINTSSDGVLEQAESVRILLTYDDDDTRVVLFSAQSEILIVDNSSELC